MQISWWTLAIQAVNFLVLVWLLQRFLYQPVLDVIEARRRRSLEASENAEAAKRQAEEAKAHYEQALAGIGAERKAALEAAHKSTEAERERVLEAARRDAQSMIGKAKAEIAAERSEALEALRRDVVALARKQARTILTDLVPSLPSAVMLERLADEIGGLPSAERQRLDKEIGENNGRLEITTALPLAAEERKRWKARIESLLAHPLDIDFSLDPDLIAGAALKLPHTTVRAAWSDLLDRAETQLMRGERAELP